MQQIRDLLQPITYEYNRYLNGHYLHDRLKMKGSRVAGNEYISKVYTSQAYEIGSTYNHIRDSIRQPTYFGFVKDNLFRLLCLNAVERLIVAYQSAPSIQRNFRPSSYNILFTQILNDGIFKGGLKGLPLNLLQLSLVLYPSMYFANKTENSKYFTFVSSFVFLDAIMNPLQVVKNNLYAHTRQPKRASQVLSIASPSIWRGIIHKSIFNLPFASALYSTAQDDGNALMWWGLTALLYPLNTLRVTYQTANTQYLGLKPYRGVLPFILLNYAFCWQLTSIFGEKRVEDEKEECQRKMAKHTGTSKE